MRSRVDQQSVRAWTFPNKRPLVMTGTEGESCSQMRVRVMRDPALASLRRSPLVGAPAGTRLPQPGGFMPRSRAIAKLSTLTLSLFAASCGSGSTPTTTAGGGSTSGGASGSGGGGAASGAVGGALGASGASGAVGGALGASGGANGGAGSGGMGVARAGAGGGGVAGNETAGAGASGSGMGGASNQTACSSGSAQAGDVTVSLSSLQQKISGFGVSSAWAGSYRNASDADFLWSTSKGAGMSLLRIRYGDGLAIAKSAAAIGVKVWMTPWGTGTNGAQGGTYTTIQNNPNGCKTGNMPVLTNPSGLASALV